MRPRTEWTSAAEQKIDGMPDCPRGAIVSQMPAGRPHHSHPLPKLLGCTPEIAEHSFVLGRWLGDRPLGAHHLHRVLLLPGFAVLALIQFGLGHTIFPQDLQSTHVERGILRPAQKRHPGSAQRLCGKSGYLCELVLQHLLRRPDVGEEEV